MKNLNTLKMLAVIVMAIVPALASSETRYTVKSGDNLWNIANSNKAPGVTTHQMIAAIHKKNAAVLGSDINNIRSGMVLEIPTQDEALDANSGNATRLLLTNSPSRADKVAELERQIDYINNQIGLTVEALKTSQTQFERMH